MTKILNQLMFIFLAAIVVLGVVYVVLPAEQPTIITSGQLKKFSSGEDLLEALEDAKNKGGFVDTIMEMATSPTSLGANFGGTMAMKESSVGGTKYSKTNTQVEGVDEADIIKTDGEYIYLLAKNKLIIAKAYPGEDAKILYEESLGQFSPQELFIHQDRLLIFGYANYKQSKELGDIKEITPYKKNFHATAVKLFDISDKEDPELLRTVDFEGNYLTSRKINDKVYFVINNHISYYNSDPEICEEVVPRYREDNNEPQPISKCTDIGYVDEVEARNFLTLATISMTDENQEIEKETILGNGQSVYASLNSIYIAQSQRVYGFDKLTEESKEKTIVTKFNLNKGKINYIATGEIPGRILNQFSMDEHENHFRIATTKGNVWGEKKSSNNVYVLNSKMRTVGELEDLAPGERIYSVRFMGDRGYVVTFKKVDPLFVIDLANPNNPTVLGKLKIPGYSDYLHPYDENHIIGIGKDTVEAEENLKNQRDLDFAWYQGIKMAIFDVSNVENPIELHKIVIGDRGTNSEALHNHKAFLFDREKNLLVLPITLAEIKGEKTSDNQHGEYTFQGAYVFDLTLNNGFQLQGKVSHYDDDQVYKKSGYYFSGKSTIRRSLFIENILYTLSDSRLQLNNLDSLKRLKVLEFGEEKEKEDNYGKPVIIY
jgi:inhibitor of cysteine peptidase